MLTIQRQNCLSDCIQTFIFLWIQSTGQAIEQALWYFVLLMARTGCRGIAFLRVLGRPYNLGTQESHGFK